MYDRDTVELLLLALDEGMGVTRAAREVGVSLDTARRWACCRAAAPRRRAPRVESGPTRPERPEGEPE